MDGIVRVQGLFDGLFVDAGYPGKDVVKARGVAAGDGYGDGHAFLAPKRFVRQNFCHGGYYKAGEKALEGLCKDGPAARQSRWRYAKCAGRLWAPGAVR